MGEHLYSVTYWGSHPYADNDDCETGFDFATLAEAEAQYQDNDPRYQRSGRAIDWTFVMLDGPGVNQVRSHPMYDEAEDRCRRAREIQAEREAERREAAIQAGMAFGCEGYNDEMGW